VSKTRIRLIKQLCKSCGYCIEFCPNKVFEKSETLNEKGVMVPVIAHGERCTACGLCVLLCPDFALMLEEEKDE